MKFKKILALACASILVFSNSFVFANEAKPVLTVDEAIKKSIQSNTNLLKYELTRETLLKGIDETYTSSKSVFSIFDNQMQNLPAPGTPQYDEAKRNLENDFKKAIANSDVAVSKLINERGNIDLAKIVEIENTGVAIKKLFTSINQKEVDIKILEQKIALDQRLLNSLQKQLELGRVSQVKYKEQELELSKNANKLKAEKSALNIYYNELSALTRIDGIQSKYSLEKYQAPYKPIILSEATQNAQNERAVAYSINVATKINDTKIKQTIFDNYPNVTTEGNYLQTRDSKDIAQLEESQAKVEAKKNSQAKYDNLQQIQGNITIALKDIEKIKLQTSSTEKLYKAGKISKNNYESSLFALQEAENQLSSLYIQHYQLRLMYENPYLAGQ